MKNTTLKPRTPVYIIGSASVVGQQERKGPIGASFDISEKDDFGMDSFEKAEAKMQCLALGCAMSKAGLTEADLDCMLAGDLINQCISSSYGLMDYRIPYFGLYGACSTCAEGLLLGALSGLDRCAAVTSSHFCSAERQFRFPLEYGGQRPPTSQWTVTGSGAFILSTLERDCVRVQGDFVPEITELLPGCIVDRGISDAGNMGAAMAPAAADTLERYFQAGHTPEESDLIVTGDLGHLGMDLLLQLARDDGMNLGGKLTDCGTLVFDNTVQDVHAGGSGCGCSASVLAGHILQCMAKGIWNRVLFAATGALMSTTSSQQGQSIPGICHAVAIENEVK